ncbi:MAG: hypothetical protein MK212_10950 [Saprospiraceae bacterium]|nr:hypothetical protein [Saprospiraceae bacterium]
MFIFKRFLYFSLFAVVLSACSTTRIVKPLAKKELAIGLDFGGPLFGFAGTTIPVPLSSLSAAYGVDSMLTTFGALHLTDAAFGLIHLEGGVVRDLYKAKPNIPKVSAGGTAHFMLDTWQGNFRFYPQIDLNCYWTYGKKRMNYVYFTLTNWFDFFPLAHNQPNRKFYTPNLALGHTFANKHMRYTLEMKYLTPGSPNSDLIPSYRGIGGRGAVGIYMGVSYRFSKREKIITPKF